MKTHSSTLEHPDPTPPAPPELIAAVPPTLVVDQGADPASPWRRPVVAAPIIGGVVLVVVALVLLRGGNDDTAPTDAKAQPPKLSVQRAAGGKAWQVSWTHTDPVRQLLVLTVTQPPQDGITFVRGSRALIPVALLDDHGGCVAISTTAPATATSTTTIDTPAPDGGLTPLTTVPSDTTRVELKGFDVICTNGLALDAVRR